MPKAVFRICVSAHARLTMWRIELAASFVKRMVLIRFLWPAILTQSEEAGIQMNSGFSLRCARNGGRGIIPMPSRR